jgi:hypothetical protein
LFGLGSHDMHTIELCANNSEGLQEYPWAKDMKKQMEGTSFHEDNCENCAYLALDDTCGCRASVYFGRPVVYRDGAEVVQTAWCEKWEQRAE